jgi:tetratricopeptide (TPR) repeat protein
MHLANGVSPELVSLFNQAARLSRVGRHEDALETWERLFSPEGVWSEADTLAASPCFLAVAAMRRAWVLMDLGRFDEARERFERGLLPRLLDLLPATERFDYWFSYGNTLAELGELEEADAALGRAICVAMSDLNDNRRASRAWSRLLDIATDQHAWGFLAREGEAAASWAASAGEPSLEVSALWRRALALRVLGREAEAHDALLRIRALAETLGLREARAAVELALSAA